MHASVRLIEVSGIPYKPSCDVSTSNACRFQLKRVYGTVPAIMSYIIIIILSLIIVLLNVLISKHDVGPRM